MSGFVATAPSPASTTIPSGDWYPAIDPTHARCVMRIDGTVTEARLREVLSVAVAAIEDQLDSWQQQQAVIGRHSLADVPSKTIDGQSRLILLFQRAVYAEAQAELIERYRDFDATDSAIHRSHRMDGSVDDYRRHVRYALRDIVGRPRADVELL